MLDDTIAGLRSALRASGAWRLNEHPKNNNNTAGCPVRGGAQRPRCNPSHPCRHPRNPGHPSVDAGDHAEIVGRNTLGNEAAVLRATSCDLRALREKPLPKKGRSESRSAGSEISGRSASPPSVMPHAPATHDQACRCQPHEPPRAATRDPSACARRPRPLKHAGPFGMETMAPGSPRD